MATDMKAIEQHFHVVLDIFDFFLLYLKMQAIFSLKMPSVK